MINQVIFEGYLIKSWEFQEQRYLRLAGHRTPEAGSSLVQSDYVTVQLEAGLKVDPRLLKQGTRMVVTGKIWGRDIVETLGRILQKADLAVDLPQALDNLVIHRPSVQILAAQLEVIGQGNRPRERQRTKNSQPPQIVKVRPEEAPQPEAQASVVGEIQPGVDLASLIAQGDEKS